MRVIIRLFFLTWLVAASLSSCSRATYSFHPTAPAYPPTTITPLVQDVAKTHLAKTAVVASTENVGSPLTTATTHLTANALVASKLTSSAGQVTPLAVNPMSNATILRKQVTPQGLRSLKAVKEEGKSKLVAALLCCFLGGLGIYGFYRGYSGLSIL